MTFILTINRSETIWLLADRRISHPSRPPKDDACKVMFLETTDGVAILGYAGLGTTVNGTEPADWMSAVLRGRSLPLEQSLGVLASALQRQFPKHLLTISGSEIAAHNIMIPAFVNNKVRLYTIDIALTLDRQAYNFRYTRHVRGGIHTMLELTPPFSVSGSGLIPLERDRTWIPELLHLVRAYEKEKVSQDMIADTLAAINYEVHLSLADKSVGPRCIVAWRHRKKGRFKGGGGQRFYNGKTLDNDSLVIPNIANGMDVRALVTTSTPHMLKAILQGRETGVMPKIDIETMNAEVAKLPDYPEEDLR